MIIVTGTKRSGTSMWMQILTAAGLPAFGEAFPRNWGETLREANPDGFYESILRSGIYWRTNPHPTTGAYFFPEQVTDHVVKVFVPGLVRTDRAYIGHVVATVRHYREYEASIGRLYAMEDEARKNADRPHRAPRRMPPLLEWWHENFMLLRDIVVRRYRVHVQSYDGLLDDPATVIRDTMRWLGRGDAEAAIAAVKPELRTQVRPEGEPLDPALEEVFELLYQTVHERRGLTAALIQRWNEANVVLAPRIAEAQKAVMLDQRRRRANSQDARDPHDDEDLSSLPSWP